MKRKIKLLKRIVFVAILIYAIITFIKQQKILNTYTSQSENLNVQIAVAKEYQQQLKEKKDNVTSAKYLENVAREKLDMYMPNERVYIDNQNQN